MSIFMESQALLHRAGASVAVCACRRGPATEARRVRAPRRNGPSGGLVAPLANDTSDDIVSWVDGQVVTDWAAEIAKRERAIDGYLNDADPAAPRSTVSAAARIRGWPGAGSATTRSGSTACRSCSSRRSSISIPITRTRRCAPSPGSGSARRSCPPGSGAPAADGRFDHIGIGPNPSDYVDGVARPASERQSPLPFGFAFENPRSFEPLSAAETTRLRRPAAGAARLPEHEPAGRQGARRGHGGELGTRSAGLRQPGRDGSRVLLVRGLPRRPRDGRRAR